MKRIDLSIIAPAYNEPAVKEFVEELLEIAKDFTKKSISTEVIAVDNGSTDETGKILDSLKGRKNLVVLSTPIRGVGRAYKKAIPISRGKHVAFMMSDGQEDARDIMKLLKILREERDDYGAIVGWRKERRDPLMRKVYSRFYNLLVKILFGIKVPDVNGGPRVFVRQAIAGHEVESKRWAVNVELLHEAMKREYRIGFAPVKHFPRRRGKSSVRFATIFEMLDDLIRLRLGAKQRG